MRVRIAALNLYEAAIVALFAIGDGAIAWLAIAALIRTHNGNRTVVAPLAIGAGVLLANVVPRVSLPLGWRWWVGYLLTGLGFIITIAIWTKSAAAPQAGWTDFGWVRDLVDGFAVKGDGAGEVVWLSVLGAGFVWRKGAGRSSVGIDAANEQLRQGGLAVIAALGINALVPAGVGNGAASLAAIVSFAASLTAIALARATTTIGGVDVGRTKSPSIIAGPAVVIVGVGLLAGALISRDLLNAIVWLLSFPVGAIWFVGRYLIIALAFAVLIVLWPLFWLLQKWLPQPANMKITMPSAPPQDANKLVPGSDPTQIPNVLRYGIAALVLLIVCLVVVRIASNRRQLELVAGDETREKLEADGEGSLFGDLWARFRGRRPGPDPLADLRGRAEWAHTVAIREAFGQFLEWTRERGLAREAAETATEHGAAFEASLPSPSQDAETLVAGYQRIRYRHDPADQRDAEAVVEAWRRLRRDSPRPNGEQG